MLQILSKISPQSITIAPSFHCTNTEERSRLSRSSLWQTGWLLPIIGMPCEVRTKKSNLQKSFSKDINGLTFYLLKTIYMPVSLLGDQPFENTPCWRLRHYASIKRQYLRTPLRRSVQGKRLCVIFSVSGIWYNRQNDEPPMTKL